MRRCLLLILPCLVSLGLTTASAEAVVVDMNPTAHGQPAVAYPTDAASGYYYGVALVPGAREASTPGAYLAAAGIPVVTSSAPCADPAAASEPDILSAGSWPLALPVQPICWHNGAVMHANETFTLEWEGQSPHTYWSGTKNFVQTYLSDVAAAKGSLNSPYADTTQYWDGPSPQDRAANNSLFGGGCDDNGTANCQFGSVTGSGPGNPLPSASACPVTSGPGDICLTDAQIRNEVTTLVDKDSLIAHTQTGCSPVVVVLTPPGAVVCLDSGGSLCSANGVFAPAQPTLTTTSTGGTVPAGSYQVVVSYTTSGGNTVASAPASVAVSGATSTITVASPPPHTGVTGWNVYFTGPNGSSYALQSGSMPIGQAFTLGGAPTTGAAPRMASGSFCSYHSQVVDAQSNQAVTYLVQPWTAFTSCDEPDASPLPNNPTPEQQAQAAGVRLVSPLSQASMGAIVNPGFSGWFGLDGTEINDQNGCVPLNQGLDSFTVGPSGQNPYLLQREFNNAAVVDSDPNTYGGCLPTDVLTPAFVAPSAISLGDTLDLDGSSTASSLAIPNANYTWDFGDGSAGVGPSVAHTYAAAGTYTVKLTVTDRGGNAATITHSVQVLTVNGLPAPPPSPPPTSGPTGSSSGSGGAFSVKLRLLPQGLKTAARHGIAVQVSSNEAADGFAQVWISRKAARRAHLKRGRQALVLVGFGTVSGIKNGVGTLNVRMRPRLARKLGRLHRVTLTVRLVLTGADGHHVVVDVAGVY